MLVTFGLGLLVGPNAVGDAAFTLWIAWLAIEFGLLGGVLGALGAVGLLMTASGLTGDETVADELLSRGIPFLGIGLVTGALAERLRTREREHRALIERLPLATYVEPAAGRGVTYLSPQIEELTGYPPERWLGGGLYPEVLHPEDHDWVLEAQREARERRQPLSQRYRMVRADGTVVWVDDRSVVIPGPFGSWRRQGFVVDVTQEKESERLRQRVLAELHALIDATVDAICMTDRDGNVEIANEPLRALAVELGLPVALPAHEQLLAIADRFVDPDAFRARLQEIAATPDEPSRDEFELRDGRVFQGFTQPVVEAGDYLGRVWTLREVTEERELTRLHDEFLSTVSHELRTPLTSISGFVELLSERAGDLGEAEQRYLATVARNVARLCGLVDDLLLMRQIGSDRFTVHPAPLDLGAVFAEAVEAAGPVARAKSVELALELAGEARIEGDRERLAQVADNLIGNAVKFTPSGGRVDVRVSATTDRAVVVVEDDGIGIPQPQLAHVFDPFFRASSATAEAVPGTGLGLSIAKAIVEAHGGTIGVESRPGSGSAFSVELPLSSGMPDGSDEGPAGD